MFALWEQKQTSYPFYHILKMVTCLFCCKVNYEPSYKSEPHKKSWFVHPWGKKLKHLCSYVCCSFFFFSFSPPPEKGDYSAAIITEEPLSKGLDNKLVTENSEFCSWVWMNTRQDCTGPNSSSNVPELIRFLRVPLKKKKKKMRSGLIQKCNAFHFLKVCYKLLQRGSLF